MFANLGAAWLPVKFLPAKTEPMDRAPVGKKQAHLSMKTRVAGGWKRRRRPRFKGAGVYWHGGAEARNQHCVCGDVLKNCNSSVPTFCWPAGEGCV